jgi:uncharacterized membrane protein YhaH (DUF805 family)
MPRNPQTAEAMQLFFTLEGRLSRLQYFQLWLVLLALGVVARLSLLLLALIFSPLVMTLFSAALLVLAVALAIGNICLAVRRWHDLDCSGWFTLLGLVPLVNFIAMLVLFFAPGTPGPNRFGPNPRAPVAPARPQQVKLSKTTGKTSARKPQRKKRR